MTTLREAAQQALEALETPIHEHPLGMRQEAITALRAALAQQAEPVEPRRWEGDHNIESPFNACMHKSYCITLKQALAQQAEPVLQGPVAWRYWKQKWNCWEYSDTKLEFPAVPAGTKMEPLYLVSREVKSELPPVGTVHKSVKGGVVWNRWPDEMEDGTKLHASPAQQAKIDEIAVEQWKLRMVFYDENGEPSMSRQPEPDEIRAALAQQAEPPGCDHCNHPLYAATRCRVCGRVTEPAEPVEPVEPVAWVRLEAWKSGKDWPDDCFTALPAEGLTPVYTAPPQRKPLTDEDILRVLMLDPPNPSLWPHLKGEAIVGDVQQAVLAIVRAVERAHGITGDCK